MATPTSGAVPVARSEPRTRTALLLETIRGAPSNRRAMLLVKSALWDNSNIIESYSGVTTPLTFSFARKAYENVYRELLLGSVPRS